MKIVVDVNHAAHIHMLKNFILCMEKKGHRVLITATKKEAVFELLNKYSFDYIDMGSYGSSLFQKLVNMIIMDIKMYINVKKFHPDLFIGLGSLRASHVAKMLGKKCIIFEDSEHTKFQNMFYLPFATYVLSSYTFKDNYGKKHIKYQGFDELAYLHPKYFSPDESVLSDLGLEKKDKFILLRFSSWEAIHDLNQSGFNFGNQDELLHFIKHLEHYGCKVLISSEKELPKSIELYQLKIPAHKIHDLISFAYLYIGEGATMAAEAAALGTPSIYVSSISLGYIEKYRDYGLVHTCQGFKSALSISDKLLSNDSLKEEYLIKKNKMIKENIDVTKFIIDFVEKLFVK